MFDVLLSFGESLARKCVSLNNESCVSRPTLIDSNPIELNYYPFMINLNKCFGSYNTVDYLSTEVCVPSKAKDVNVKLFKMITMTNEEKPLVKHI